MSYLFAKEKCRLFKQFVVLMIGVPDRKEHICTSARNKFLCAGLMTAP
jgi:hypothetical protein